MSSFEISVLTSVVVLGGMLLVSLSVGTRVPRLMSESSSAPEIVLT